MYICVPGCRVQAGEFESGNPEVALFEILYTFFLLEPGEGGGGASSLLVGGDQGLCLFNVARRMTDVGFTCWLLSKQLSCTSETDSNWILSVLDRHFLWVESGGWVTMLYILEWVCDYTAERIQACQSDPLRAPCESELSRSSWYLYKQSVANH